MMQRQQKQYETPERAWDEDRIDTERTIRQDYGLKNKKEVWKAQSTVRQFRRQARELNAVEDEARTEELLTKLQGLGILDEGAELNDVLDIGVEDVLERRLQTIVRRRGLAETMNEARQLVNHGHIMIDERRVTTPGYLVDTAEEDQIRVSPGSQHLIE